VLEIEQNLVDVLETGHEQGKVIEMEHNRVGRA
jgi:hypothetical protein